MVVPNDALRRWKLPVRYPEIRSERAREVARWFGLREMPPGADADVNVSSLLPGAGQIVLVTGASGAGKSSLLGAMRAASASAAEWCDLARVRVPEAPLVDCFEGLSLTDVLSLLARVGLSEAWTFVRTPSELSEGQRWRLRLGLALHEARKHANFRLVCDEFAAVLDRVTACVVAHALARVVRASRSPGNLGAILVTSHDDLAEAIGPDVWVRCDFGSATVLKSQI